MWFALSHIFRQKNILKAAIWIFVIYTVVYLLVTQFLVVSFAASDNPIFAVSILPNWADVIFRARAPFLFESVGSVHLTPYVTIFLSIPNLIIAFLLSFLVSLNLAASYFVFRKVGFKGRSGVVSLIGTVPALIGGAACCVPTLILVLGLQFTATLTTVWPWFVPLSFILLLISLWWVLRKAAANPKICPNSSRV